MNKTCLVYILVLLAQVAGSTPWALAEGPAEIRPRIISLYAGHTEILLRLGARDHLVGISAHETYEGPETQGWTRPPVFSVHDDVEVFLVAAPDIILLRPFHLGAGSRLMETLASTGIIIKPLQVLRPDDLYQYWRALAELVGGEAAGEKMVQDFDRSITAYRQAASQMPLEKKPGVFLEAVHKQVKTFTQDSLPYWLVELAGGRNVAEVGKSRFEGQIIGDYGPERLLMQAEEIDVFISQQGIMNMTPLEQINDRKIYQPLRAMQEGRVYKIPEKYLARPTPSLLVGLELISGITGLEVPALNEEPLADLYSSEKDEADNKSGLKATEVTEAPAGLQ